MHLGLPFLVMSHPLGNGKKTGSNSPDQEKLRQPCIDGHVEVWLDFPKEGALPWAGTDLGLEPKGLRQARHVWVWAQGSEAKAE